VPGEQLSTIEGALAELEKAKDGDDKAAIESKIEKLEQAAQSLNAVAQGAGAGGPQAGPQGGASGPADDVVDAEFTEVKGDDKK